MFGSIPPVPPPDEDSTSCTHSTERRDYRIVTNGVTFAVQTRYFCFFWEVATTAPDPDWAEGWITEQIRRARERSKRWRRYVPPSRGWPPIPNPLLPPPPPPPPNTLYKRGIG